MSTDAQINATASRMLMRLRGEVTRRDTVDHTAPAALAGITDLILSVLDAQSKVATIEGLRASAVALAAVRQTFLASHDLSDMNLTDVMPVIRYLSLVAEGLVAVSDELAADALVAPADDLFGTVD